MQKQEIWKARVEKYMHSLEQCLSWLLRNILQDRHHSSQCIDFSALSVHISASAQDIMHYCDFLPGCNFTNSPKVSEGCIFEKLMKRRFQ